MQVTKVIHYRVWHHSLFKEVGYIFIAFFAAFILSPMFFIIVVDVFAEKRNTGLEIIQQFITEFLNQYIKVIIGSKNSFA